MHRLLKIDDAAGTLAYRLEGREGLAISLVLINSAMETADFDAATPTPEVSHSKSSPQTHTDALHSAITFVVRKARIVLSASSD